MFKIIKKGFSSRLNKEAAYMLRLVEIPEGFALTCFWSADILKDDS